MFDTLKEALTNFFLDSSGTTAGLPENYRIIVNLLFYTILITIYAIFIWKFYKFLARRDILKLNLNKYNKSDHPFLSKFFATLLFLLEYIIILPFIVTFWFAIFSLFFLLLSKSQTATQILLITAAVVASIRITSYLSEDLSKDLAKMVPFAILAIFLLDPLFFSLEKFILRIKEIPSLLGHILIYCIFIISLEIFMRALFSIINLFKNEEKSRVSPGPISVTPRPPTTSPPEPSTTYPAPTTIPGPTSPAPETSPSSPIPY